MGGLGTYEGASKVRKRIKHQDVYVRVIGGPKVGMIAKVKEVKHHNYSRSDFLLHVDGIRAFTVNGKHLVELVDYVGPTSSVVEKEKPKEYFDFFNRKIKQGDVIYFARSGKSRGGIEMVMGTVKTLDNKGLWASVFQVNEQRLSSTDLIRVSKPERSLIIDAGITNYALIAKISGGFA